MDPAKQLAVVEYRLLRVDPRLASLHHVVALFTQLLDVAPLVSLQNAAAHGSVRLLDRVATRTLADSSLAKALVDFRFARAMQAALERDDLAMVQCIHAYHPTPLYVYVPVTPPIVYATPLGLAFQYGTLETVQWLLAHRADRACCPPGVSNYCRGCLYRALPCMGGRDAFRIVTWLFECGLLDKAHRETANQVLWRAMQWSPRLVGWLAERELICQEKIVAVLYQVINQRGARDAVALLDLITVPMPVVTAEQYLLLASFRGLDEVVEKMIALGHCTTFQHKFELSPTISERPRLVQWHREFMNGEEDLDPSETTAGVCRSAASQSGNLLALQWLYSDRNVRPKLRALASDVDDEPTLLKIYEWMHAVGMELPTVLMDGAAGKGFFTVVQWLHQHSRAGCTTAAMDNAAANGHLLVVQWLHANRSEGCTTNAASAAAENGHLEIVQWFHHHRPEDLMVRVAMRHAAAFGELDVLVWLTLTFPEATCRRCIVSYVLDGTFTTLSRVKSIDILRWNDAQPAVLCDVCRATTPHRSRGMITASCEGDLELVTYGYDCHREKLHFVEPAKTIRRVAQGGHLRVLKWIEATFGAPRGDVDVSERWDGDWTEAIEEARACGHSHIVPGIRSMAREAVDA